MEEKQTSVHGNDQNIFFNTTGNLSHDRWGYYHEYHEALFPKSHIMKE
jgi:hypothetical protein